MSIHRKISQVPILMYHSISSQATQRFKPFALSPELFARQMAYLHEHAYTPITVAQFVKLRAQGNHIPERAVILTFDDAFSDFYTEALPVLKRYGFVATLYVPTAFVGGTSLWLKPEGEAERPLLNWQQLQEVSAEGIECGGHSHTHAQLDVLRPAEAYDEMRRCKLLLEDHLGQEVISFAYPFGYSNATVWQLVQKAEYAAACAVKHAMCSTAIDLFALVRFKVLAHTSVEALAAMLHLQTATQLINVQRDIQAVMWRSLRRCMASATHAYRKEILLK
jgi:peptidoglycan/xylan/chitin deacetylase (PgdA/CDA1 family)